MGYYSSFTIVDSNFEDAQELIDKLHKFSETYNWADPGWETRRDGSISGYESTKWYDWDEDLKQYAYQHPEDYFIVLRYGEESPDMSRVIVKNGKAVEQVPNISWPEVDIS